MSPFGKNTFVISLLLFKLCVQIEYTKTKVAKLHNGQKVEKDPILKTPLCLG